MTAASHIFRRLTAPLLRFHADERGEMFEYVLVLAGVGIPAMAISSVLFKLLTDYFSSVAFNVGWPFL